MNEQFVKLKSERWSLLAPFPRPGLVKFNKIYTEQVN